MRNRSRNDRRARATSLALLALLLFQVFSVALIYPSATSAQVSGTQQGFIQIRGLGSYGSWFPYTETPAQVETIVSEIHNSTGRNITIFSFVDGAELPANQVQGWNGSVNTYLSAIKQKAGGDIVPTLDLDYYMSGSPWLSHSYCDPDNSTDCGPSFFFKMSAELLNLTAIGSGGREVLLDSWPTMSRYENESVITGVLQNLTDQGWHALLMKEDQSPSDPFPDFGYANYLAVDLSCSFEAPFCSPLQGIINQEYINDIGSPEFRGVFSLFDYQTINNPKPQTAFDLFAANLTADEQASALSSLASLQSTGKYTMIYPVLVNVARDGDEFEFDANRETMTDGTPMLSVIESLVAFGSQTSLTDSTRLTITNSTTSTTTSARSSSTERSTTTGASLTSTIHSSGSLSTASGSETNSSESSGKAATGSTNFLVDTLLVIAAAASVVAALALFSRRNAGHRSRRPRKGSRADGQETHDVNAALKNAFGSATKRTRLGYNWFSKAIRAEPGGSEEPRLPLSWSSSSS
jgi:hypothetical protein